jgi:4-carboxymuconolactone decarboxylase
MEDLLRRLALNDEQAVAAVLVPGADGAELPTDLDAKTDALVRLGAVLASNGTAASCRLVVEHARAARASDPEIIGVLVAVSPAIGLARLVTAAQRLALAIDVELDDLTEREPGGW